MGTLQKNIEKVKQENEILKTELRETRDQLKESEAQRERDKADSEAKLKELEEKFEAKLDKLYSLSAQHQQTSTHPVSDANISGSSNNTYLFRH